MGKRKFKDKGQTASGGRWEWILEGIEKKIKEVNGLYFNAQGKEGAP